MKEPKYDLLTVEGFNRQFEDNLVGAKTYEAAYQATELDFIEQFRHRRYKNYDSFRIARTQWRNLQKKNRGQGRQAA